MDALNCEDAMIPNFLVPEQAIQDGGNGPAVDLGSDRPAALALTLGITRVVEQESIDLAVYGSADGENFDVKPLVAFPQKFYCGTYALTLDLTAHPEVRYIRAGWKTNRWGRGDQKALFTIYVFADHASNQVMATAG